MINSSFHKSALLEIDTALGDASRRGIRIAPKSLQVNRVARTEGREPEIDQLDRLSLEEKRVSLAVEAAERGHQRLDTLQRHHALLRQLHRQLVGLAGNLEVGAALETHL